MELHRRDRPRPGVGRGRDEGRHAMKGVMQRRRASRPAGRWLSLPILALLASVMSAVAGDTDAEDMVRSGSVVIEQTQIAFIGSGNLGGGGLSYGNRNYNFTIGGLGIGGFGISKM